MDHTSFLASTNTGFSPPPMHFFTQFASGAFALCVAAHFESLIYPISFVDFAVVSAATAVKLLQASNARISFLFIQVLRGQECARATVLSLSAPRGKFRL